MSLEQIAINSRKEEAIESPATQEKPRIFLNEYELESSKSELGEAAQTSRESDEKKISAIRSEFQRKSKKDFDNISTQEREAELAEQKRFIESSGSIELNRMLAYAQLKDAVILHVAPSRTLKLSEKLRMLDDGLKKLADVLAENSKIKKVQGSSWIMQENPRLVEKLGFTVKDPSLFQKAMDKVFDFILKKKTSGTYKNAFMNREDFLGRYYKENDSHA